MTKQRSSHPGIDAPKAPGAASEESTPESVARLHALMDARPVLAGILSRVRGTQEMGAGRSEQSEMELALTVWKHSDQYRGELSAVLRDVRDLLRLEDLGREERALLRRYEEVILDVVRSGAAREAEPAVLPPKPATSPVTPDDSQGRAELGRLLEAVRLQARRIAVPTEERTDPEIEQSNLFMIPPDVLDGALEQLALDGIVPLDLTPVPRNDRVTRFLEDAGLAYVIVPGRVDPKWFRKEPYNAYHLGGQRFGRRELLPSIVFVTDAASSATFIVHNVSRVPKEAIERFAGMTKEQLRALGPGKVTRLLWNRDETLWNGALQEALELNEKELGRRAKRPTELSTLGSVSDHLEKNGVRISGGNLVVLAEDLAFELRLDFEPSRRGFTDLVLRRPDFGELLVEVCLQIMPPSADWKQYASVLKELKREGIPVDHASLVSAAEELLERETSAEVCLKKFRGRAGTRERQPFALADHLSPELCKRLKEKIVAETPPKGWMTVDGMLQRLGVSRDQDTRRYYASIHRLISRLRGTESGYETGIYRGRGPGGKIEYISPALAARILRILEDEKTQE